MAEAVSCWYQVDEKLPISIPLYRLTRGQMCLPTKTKSFVQVHGLAKTIRGLGPLSSMTWGAL